MSWGADYDFWDTQLGIQSDITDQLIEDREVEERMERLAMKGEEYDQ